MKTKRCVECGVVKCLTEFNQLKKKKDGKNIYCTKCSRKRMRAWKKKQLSDPTLRIQYFQKRLKRLLKRKYGLTWSQYRNLCDLFPVCPLCGSMDNLEIDHDHKTGKVRGRLCGTCNTAIGRLGDCVAGLTKAIEYLQQRTEL